MDFSAIEDELPSLIDLRHDLHRHPELGLEEERTSAVVARELEAAGWTVTRGFAGTGLVGTLTNGQGNRVIGLRADMDALPIEEETGLGYASENAGLMHACGHDGHTAMLIGAARGLAKRRNFDGTIHLIFQPAEENFGGGRLMIEDGLFEQFPCDAVFGLHNEPGLPFGTIFVRPGPVMAAVDEAVITIEGRGGHGAEPHTTCDPVVAAASLVMALQTIVSRNVDPLMSAVVTVGAIHGGKASNVIPGRATLTLTIRSLLPEIRDLLQTRITELAQAQAASFGATAHVDYQRSYPPTVNHADETEFVRLEAERFAGADKVKTLAAPFMGAEDFAYMLEEVPGSYFFIGSGDADHTYPVHHAKYDFNDAILPIGAAFWVDLAEKYLARD